jgi:hypothetical protein
MPKASTPYKGEAQKITRSGVSILNPELYDEGGEGVAYHEFDAQWLWDQFNMCQASIGEGKMDKNFRSDDYVCRLGGDEFVVFMVHSDEMQRKLIEMKLEKINQELSNPDDGVPSVSVSVGIVHGTQASDVETLLSKGDEAMYKSKERGKHTFTFYDK